MPEAANDRWPGAPFAHSAAGGKATRSLAAPNTCSTQEGRRSVGKNKLSEILFETDEYARVYSQLTPTQIKII
jgi:hypothetical protein